MHEAELIEFACPRCGSAVGVTPDLAGRRVRCPNPSCARGIEVPVPAAAPEPPPSVPRRRPDRAGRRGGNSAPLWPWLIAAGAALFLIGGSAWLFWPKPPKLKPPAAAEPIVEAIVFDAGGFPAGWQWIDPKGDAKADLKSKPGSLRVACTDGNDLASFTNLDAPRLLRNIRGDFELEVTLEFQPKISYQGAGLLIWEDSRSFLRLERACGGVGGGAGGVRFDRQEYGNFAAVAGTVAHPTEAPIVELKIKRVGRRFQGFWREPGKEWQSVGTADTTIATNVQVGLLLCVQHCKEEGAAVFSGLKLTKQAE